MPLESGASKSVQTDFCEFGEGIVSSNLDQIAQIKDEFHSIFQPLSSGMHKFATRNLLACLCSAASTVEEISIIFSYLVMSTLRFKTQ